MSAYKVLFGGILLDGTGVPQVENAVVVIKDHKIDAVGTVGTVSYPQDAEVIDCAGKVIMPGLIDAHLHLFGRQTMSHITQICEDPIMRGMRSVVDAWRLIDAGYTTVRDACSGNGIHLKSCISEGAIIGPRIHACGLALSQTGGHGELMHSIPTEFSNRGLTCRLADGADEVRKAAREQLRVGADYLKIYTSGGVMSEYGASQDSQYTVEEVRACTEEAHNRGKRAAAHAQGTKGIKIAILGGIDSIEHGIYMDDECLELMLKHGCYLVPTISIFSIMSKKGAKVGMPDYKIKKAESIIPIQIKSFRRAYDAGIVCGLGSDFLSDDTMTPLGGNIVEVVNYVEKAGLSVNETIVCATRNNAKILGIDDITGTVEAGKFADILVVNSSILKDIRTIANRENIYKIYKEGKEIPRLDIPELRRFDYREIYE